jgi:hypothetical protein
MPPEPIFDCSTQIGCDLLRDFLLAKLMNGFRVATQSPPLNKLFQRPRQVRLQNLMERFPVSESKLVCKNPKK